MKTDPKLKKYLEYLTLGGEIAVSFTVPILIGFWLDGIFETSPWLLLGGILIGLLLMMSMFMRIARGLNKPD